MNTAKQFQSASELLDYYADLKSRMYPAPVKRVRRTIESRSVSIALPNDTPVNFSISGWRFLVSVAAARHGTTPSAILSHKRYTLVVLARNEAVWLIRTHMPDMSWARIGRKFGREHSSVWHAFHRHVEVTAT